MARDKNVKYENETHIPSNPSILMVSTYPPNRDGIASYTFRLENALRKENVTVKIAASGRDWKKNSV